MHVSGGGETSEAAAAVEAAAGAQPMRARESDGGDAEPATEQQVEQAQEALLELITQLEGTPPETPEAERLHTKMQELQRVIFLAPVSSVEQLYSRIDTDRSDSISFKEMSEYLETRNAKNLIERTRTLMTEVGFEDDAEMDYGGMVSVFRELLVDSTEWEDESNTKRFEDPTEDDICEFLPKLLGSG